MNYLSHIVNQRPMASRLRRDRARILLCGAASVVAVFSSLVARVVARSNKWPPIARFFICPCDVIAL